MKLVYTNPNRMMVENAKNLVEATGISTRIKNEYLSAGMGELSGIDTWPELWVLNDDDCDKAKLHIKPLMTVDPGQEWFCSECEESNAATFDSCWSCQTNKTE